MSHVIEIYSTIVVGAIVVGVGVALIGTMGSINTTKCFSLLKSH
jgi:flagellar biosynthesis protein FliQ